MKRREAIQRASLVLGYAISGPALSAVLQGCKADPELTFVPQFLTKDQAALVSAVTEVIIPKTDTAGAIEAGVPGFIDIVLKDVYSQQDRDNFIKGLEAFDADAKNRCGSSFVSCTDEQQFEMVKQIHDETIKPSDGSSFGWWRADGGGSKPFIVEVKELTLLGYFSSQPGASEVLQYNVAPGPYKGCVPLSDVGKTWASIV